MLRQFTRELKCKMSFRLTMFERQHLCEDGETVDAPSAAAFEIDWIFSRRDNRMQPDDFELIAVKLHNYFTYTSFRPWRTAPADDFFFTDFIN